MPRGLVGWLPSRICSHLLTLGRLANGGLAGRVLGRRLAGVVARTRTRLHNEARESHALVPVPFVRIVDESFVGVPHFAWVVASGETVGYTVPLALLDHRCLVVGSWGVSSSVGHSWHGRGGLEGIQVRRRDLSMRRRPRSDAPPQIPWSIRLRRA